jgi:hypothetical protein
MRRGRNLLENSIKVKFFDTARNILPKAATGLLLFACVLFYLNYFEWGNFTPAMGHKIVTGVLLDAEPIVKVIVPSVSLGATIGEVSRSLAFEQLRNAKLQVPGVTSGPETDFRSLPNLDQQKLADKAAEQLLSIFESRFGPVNPNEKITDFAYTLVNKYTSSSLGGYPWVLPLVSVFIFFTAVKGVLVLLYWFFALIAYLIFKLLLVFGFAYSSMETRSREFFLLS